MYDYFWIFETGRCLTCNYVNKTCGRLLLLPAFRACYGKCPQINRDFLNYICEQFRFRLTFRCDRLYSYPPACSSMETIKRSCQLPFSHHLKAQQWTILLSTIENVQKLPISFNVLKKTSAKRLKRWWNLLMSGNRTPKELLSLGDDLYSKTSSSLFVGVVIRLLGFKKFGMTIFANPRTHGSACIAVMLTITTLSKIVSDSNGTHHKNGIHRKHKKPRDPRLSHQKTRPRCHGPVENRVDCQLTQLLPQDSPQITVLHSSQTFNQLRSERIINKINEYSWFPLRATRNLQTLQKLVAFSANFFNTMPQTF